METVCLLADATSACPPPPIERPCPARRGPSASLSANSANERRKTRFRTLMLLAIHSAHVDVSPSQQQSLPGTETGPVDVANTYHTPYAARHAPLHTPSCPALCRCMTTAGRSARNVLVDRLQCLRLSFN